MGEIKNIFTKISVFKKRILKLGGRGLILKNMILTLITMTATRRTVTTSSIMTTTMTAMKMATTMAMMTPIMMIFQMKIKGFQ